MQHVLLRFALAGVLVLTGTGLAQAQQLAPEEAEALGLELAAERPAETTVARGGLQVCVDDVLLIADSGSDGVDVHDPATGDLVIDDFILDPDNLTTPKNAIGNFDGDGIFVIDQLSDGIYEYDCDGNFVGLFAPAGGVNTAILDNAIGIDYSPDGTQLWASVTGGANADAIAAFDMSGNYVGNLFPNGEGGLDGPFDVLVRDSDVLVPAITSSNIHQYDFSGTFLGAWQSNSVSFPEQAQEISDGNVVVAEFLGGTGVYEYDSTGDLLASYSVVTGSRGVYELPNGNLLVTSGSSVKEITRSNTLVRDFGSGNQYIELFEGSSGGDPIGIDAEPESQSVAAGGVANFTYTVTNNTASAQSGVIFYQAGPLAPQQVTAGTLPAGQSFSGSFSVNVPAAAPPGTYNVAISAGGSLGNAVATDDVEVTVTAPARVAAGTATEWTLAEATPWPTTEAAARTAEVGAFPNPFARSTAISFSLDRAADVELTVYDVRGREVAVLMDGVLEAGAHEATFDASALPSGVYVWRLVSGAQVETGRVTLIK